MINIQENTDKQNCIYFC